MRLSITLDQDLHRIAASRARARGRSISREINDLLRQAFTAPPPAGSNPPGIRTEGKRQFPVSHGFQPVTTEDVARAEDEEDLRQLHT